MRKPNAHYLYLCLYLRQCLCQAAKRTSPRIMKMAWLYVYVGVDVAAIVIVSRPFFPHPYFSEP